MQGPCSSSTGKSRPLEKDPEASVPDFFCCCWFLFSAGLRTSQDPSSRLLLYLLCCMIKYLGITPGWKPCAHFKVYEMYRSLISCDGIKVAFPHEHRLNEKTQTPLLGEALPRNGISASVLRKTDPRMEGATVTLLTNSRQVLLGIATS